MIDRCIICYGKLTKSFSSDDCCKLNHKFRYYNDTLTDLSIANLYHIFHAFNEINIWSINNNYISEYLFTVNCPITDFAKGKTIEQIISKIETILVFR